MNQSVSKTQWKDLYNQKLCSAEEAAKIIVSNDKVGLSGGTCIPPAFCRALSARANELKNILLGLGFAMDFYDFMDPKNKESFEIETMFVGPVERICMQQGVSNYVPLHLGDCPSYVESRGYNIVSSVVTPPDENGYMCRSLFGSFLHKKDIAKADTVIVEVNKKLPKINSEDFMIHVSEVDHIIENDADIFEVPEIVITETEKKIASYISELIDDGSTIQLGFGGLGNAIGHNLKNKKNLGMHSEVVTPSVMELVKSGVINGSQKTFMPGKVTAAFCVGTKEFYDFIHENDDFVFKDISYINNPLIIAKNDNLVSINNALMIDLTGQAASESIGTYQYSGTGGQLNFIHGAKLSKGGKSIISLNSTFTDKNGELKSKIVPYFPPGTIVTTPRTEVEYIVTEYGVANLRYKSTATRVKALISIAHPQFREELVKKAEKNNWI
ncbi:MAG: acetyl-CoA hydrolase/transferase C-terminal domain-containing protein [Desulforegulaceae bacterium]|nr:acetyl-CoA hydrolase/transferase C-terminal domain-containing protein [Desulforegulaceae bacterium]